MSTSVFSAWSNQFGGFGFSYGTSVLVYSSIIAFVGAWLGSDLKSKLLVVFATTFSGTTMFALVGYFTSNSKDTRHEWTCVISAYLAGLLYGSGPVMFNEIASDSYTQFISYGVVPLI